MGNLKITKVKFDGPCDAYQKNRVDFKLSDGTELTLMMGYDGKIELLSNTPNRHGEFISTKGSMVKVDHYGHPSG